MSRTYRQDVEDSVFQFLADYIDKNGYPPTIRDICAGCDIQSTSTVYNNLKRLNDKGKIRYTPSTRRSIVLLDDKKPQTIPVPIVGNVAAGMPILAEENIQEYYDLPVSLLHGGTKNEVFMLNIQGNSMIDIGMYEGDTIIVNSAMTVTNGDIAVVRVCGEYATVKRFYLEGKRIRLQPENKRMEPIYAAVVEVEIIGRVVGLIRSY